MYTIGQLAESSGVSPKALRIYEKRGLLQPVRDNRNNYRLYDESAKIELQKIIMLKFLGFSLEQIKVFLEENRCAGIEECFVEQKYLLEQKKQQLETVISCIDKAIWECRENKLNMDEMLDAMNYILKNRKADEMVWKLVKFSPKASEWNCWVFEQAELQESNTILDAGAGWGNLWRMNWNRLPDDIHVTCVDKHNTWADQFEEFVSEHSGKGLIAKDTFSFQWGDMENMDFNQKFDCIFFNHTAAYMKNGDKMLDKFSHSMNQTGKLICTWGGLMVYRQIREWVSEYGDGLEEFLKKENTLLKWQNLWEDKLHNAFPVVEKRSYEVNLYFNQPEECMEYIISICKPLKPVLYAQKKKFLSFLNNKMNHQGIIEIKKDTYLYLCRKGEN